MPASLAGSHYLPVHSLRFTHDEVRPLFRSGQHCGKSLYTLVNALVRSETKTLASLPALEVVHHNGHFRSLSNRRLWALKAYIGLSQRNDLKVKVNILGSLPSNFDQKNPSHDDGKSVLVGGDEERLREKFKTSRRTCRHFFSERGCAKGDSCSFSHDLDLPETQEEEVSEIVSLRTSLATKSEELKAAQEKLSSLKALLTTNEQEATAACQQSSATAFLLQETVFNFEAQLEKMKNAMQLCGVSPNSKHHIPPREVPAAPHVVLTETLLQQGHANAAERKSEQEGAQENATTPKITMSLRSEGLEKANTSVGCATQSEDITALTEGLDLMSSHARDSAAEVLSIGARVRLEGLSNSKFNGKEAVVITDALPNGRYGLRLTESGKEVSILREKLRMLPFRDRKIPHISKASESTDVKRSAQRNAGSTPGQTPGPWLGRFIIEHESDSRSTTVRPKAATRVSAPAKPRLEALTAQIVAQNEIAERTGPVSVAASKCRELLEQTVQLYPKNAFCIGLLGCYYAHGKGGEELPKEGAELLIRADAAGDLRATVELGRLRRTGTGLPKDEAIARELSRKAHMAGGRIASFELATMWAEGAGGRKDDQ